MKSQSAKRNVILVTGGTGYIGSRLIYDLATDPHFADYTIRVYDNLHRPNYNSLMDLPSEGRYEFIEGDILDRINLERAMQGVDVVAHLAALVHTPLSFDNPEWTKQINHWGTASVVDASVSAGVSQLLYASSVSVYGPGGPFRETDACRPVGPYAMSKLKGEEEVRQGDWRGLKSAIVRLGTVFGNAPSMRFEAVANRLAYLAGVGRPLIIHGSGQQLRPLIHIADASAALRLCLSNSLAAGEIINATTMSCRVDEIANTLQALRPAASIRYTDQDFLTEISFDIDSSKLMAMGFRSQFDLRQGLEEILARWQGFQPAFSG